MNEIEALYQRLKKRFADSAVHVTSDFPERSGGSWYIDVMLPDRIVVVEWRPRPGFKVSIAARTDVRLFSDCTEKTYRGSNDTFKSVCSLMEKPAS